MTLRRRVAFPGRGRADRGCVELQQGLVAREMGRDQAAWQHPEPLMSDEGQSRRLGALAHIRYTPKTTGIATCRAVAKAIDGLNGLSFS